ncbi:hypothetical protein Hesp01_72770 [Herbidospora sp. NBRC 101105]|nr:hypothetical protein Hesp01_72770 [Herbidospora sp. NBRC 101105]
MCLVAAGFARLHGRLVLELAVVHELADGRACRRRDLNEIEVGLLGELQGVVDGDDADLLAVRADEADLGDTNTIVDAGLGADGTSKGPSPVCSTVPETRIDPGTSRMRGH